MGLVLSGVQPTGNLHLGNYLGAIKQWVEMQGEHECLFMLADLHAITVRQEPADLQESVLKTAALYIACGIDPEKSAIFNQSKVSGHAELGWILSCNTPIGQLNRMTQFKDKAGKDKEKASLGLYSYPVLMASDILLYNADKVPVGDDQRQHLELSRYIAEAFNRNYDNDFFTVPEPFFIKNAARVMSLKDAGNKMSKSDPSDNSRINLNDDVDLIIKKLKKAQTDAIEGISYEPAERPAVANLLNIYSAFEGCTSEEAARKFADYNFAKFKPELAEYVASKLAPIKAKYDELSADKVELEKVLAKGAEKANELAEKNLSQVKEIVGFI